MHLHRYEAQRKLLAQIYAGWLEFLLHLLHCAHCNFRFQLIFSAYDYVVPARGKILVKTDIQIEVPTGCYGRVAPRSGLALKNSIDVGAGVIDEDYRGNVGVILFNFSEIDFEVKKGDRIAQLICERIAHPNLVEVDTLTETARGEGGFGSTGTN